MLSLLSHEEMKIRKIRTICRDAKKPQSAEKEVDAKTKTVKKSVRK